jgi:tetratricopeptide (TPR) repeat protein
MTRCQRIVLAAAMTAMPVALWAQTQAAPIVPAVAPAPVLVMPFVFDAAPGTSGLSGAPFWMGEAAAIALGDGLAARGVTTMSRADRVGAFEQLQLPASGSLTRATLIRAGEMIGASAIVVGEVKLTDRMEVRARVIDLASGRQFPDVSADGASNAFFDILDRIGRGLTLSLPHSAVPPPPPDRLEIAAFEDYVKGLVATSPEIQLRFLEAALAHSPTDARSLLALWEVRTAQGDHARALEAASRVLPTSHLARESRFLAAQSLMALKRYDEAFKALDALYKEKPAASISNALGVLQLRRGPQAPGGSPAFFFNRAVDEGHTDPDIAFNLGYAYAMVADVSSAIYWLREAVRREPADGDAHRVLSVMLAAQSKTVEAQREFDLAKVLGAVDSGAVPDKTMPKALERLLPELAPPFDWRHLLVGVAEQEQTAAFYIDRGKRLSDEMRDREAIDELRRAIYVSPYLDRPHILLGRIYQRTGRLADASDEYSLALWCQETAEAHAALASVQLLSGKRELARASANRALALDPTNVEAREVLRQLGLAPSAGVLKSA